MRKFVPSFKTTWSVKINKYGPLLVAVLLVGGIGTTLLLTSHAATPTANIEAESGIVSSAASTVADTTASGSTAVKFGTSTGGGGTVPAQCASGGTYLWSNLETCGWPGPANTGPVLSQCPGGVLTNVGTNTKSTTTVSTAGTTISCENITGCLHITAQNVTVTNVKIACTSGKTGEDANGTLRD